MNALLAFGWSFVVLPPSLEGRAYYEILYWGGGHALQFTWTLRGDPGTAVDAVPVAVVRVYAFAPAEASAKALIRAPEKDLFR